MIQLDNVYSWEIGRFPIPHAQLNEHLSIHAHQEPSRCHLEHVRTIANQYFFGTHIFWNRRLGNSQIRKQELKRTRNIDRWWFHKEFHSLRKGLESKRILSTQKILNFNNFPEAPILNYAIIQCKVLDLNLVQYEFQPKTSRPTIWAAKRHTLRSESVS